MCYCIHESKEICGDSTKSFTPLLHQMIFNRLVTNGGVAQLG